MNTSNADELAKSALMIFLMDETKLIDESFEKDAYSYEIANLKDKINKHEELLDVNKEALLHTLTTYYENAEKAYQLTIEKVEIEAFIRVTQGIVDRVNEKQTEVNEARAKLVQLT